MNVLLVLLTRIGQVMGEVNGIDVFLSYTVAGLKYCPFIKIMISMTFILFVIKELDSDSPSSDLEHQSEKVCRAHINVYCHHWQDWENCEMINFLILECKFHC